MTSKIVSSKSDNLSQCIVLYDLCILCQSVKKLGNRKIESLTDPFKNPRKNVSESYKSIVANLKVFHEYTDLPRHLSYLLKDANLAANLEKENAVWHKSCHLCYSNTKAEKIRSKHQKSEPVPDDHEIRDGAIDSNRAVSTVEVPLPEVKDDMFKCLLCDSEDSISKLHSLTSSDTSKKMHDAAIVLNDYELLARVEAGILIPAQTKYHLSCITKLYNDARGIHRQNNTKKGSWLESVAFADLCEYIKATIDQNEKVVLPLSDLYDLIVKRMQDLGSSYSIHKTRLKEKLTAEFPDLTVTKCGKQIVFFRNAFQVSSHHENDDEDAKVLLLASKIVRAEESKRISIDDVNQKSSVNQKLLTLVSLILRGSGSDLADDDNSQPVLTIAQLIRFNMSKKNRNSDTIRHHVDQETPLVRYVANLLHHDKRAKTLINKFHYLGLCISYKRELEISTAVGNRACDKFQKDGVVAPTNIPKNQFVTMAVDNIDHNMSSTTSKGSFHGTAITVHAHPDSVMASSVLVESNDFGKEGLRLKSLPTSYTIVEPVVEQDKKDIKTPLFPRISDLSSGPFDAALQTELDWITLVEDKLNDDSRKNVNLKWSSFHANLQDKTVFPCTIGLLPLFQESAHTSSMIYHAMKICQQVTNHLNEGQTPVCACDEPLFSLFKELQWTYPQLFGKMFPVMGSLHLEMVLLRCLGQLLDGSEWNITLAEAGIATPGIADSFLTVSHVMKCRYSHEVTYTVLEILQRRAFKKRKLSDYHLSFTEWLAKAESNFPNFQYWNSVLKLERVLFMFVRAVRESNFDLYVGAMVEATPWIFVLDHTKYCKWIVVHIEELKNLKTTFPDVHTAFNKGMFVVQKSANQFSAIGIDHAHEQQNAIIKGDGGAIGLTDNPASLLRWMVAGPEVSRLITSFEKQCSSMPSNKHTNTKHHSQSQAEQLRFMNDVNSLLSTLEQYGNPFEDESPYLVTLVSKSQLDEQATQTVKRLEEIGKTQYRDFLQKRLQSHEVNFYEPVKMNKLNIFKEKPVRKVSAATIKNKMLRNDCDLFSRLYLGATNRKVDLDQFFNYENQPFPPSISNNGHLRNGPKSNIVDCLRSEYKDVDLEDLDYGSHDDATAFVVDGSVIVHFINSAGAKTFGEYSSKIQQYFHQFTTKYQRIDVIWDVYLKNTIKRDAREKRGTGRVQKVESTLKLPQKWTEFLKADENKNRLYKLLAVDIVKIDAPDCLIVTNVEQNVLTSKEHDTSRIAPCNHEEADTRLFVHVKDAVLAGHTRVVIRTVDSDIVVLAAAFYASTDQIQELYVAYGTKKQYKFIPVHLIVRSLGISRSLALPFFHAITGCDTVSCFFGRGKQMAWSIWNLLGEDLTTAFLNIKDDSWDDIENSKNFGVIQKFVGMLYDCKYAESTHANLDVLRKHLFVHKDRTTIENLPPTTGSFVQHLKRAVYQGSLCWGLFHKTLNLPDPTLWGWKLCEDSYVPHWTDLPELSKACRDFIKCSCKNGTCSNRCGCKQAKIVCAIFCSCKGDCRSKDNQHKKDKNNIIEE